jgi:hypothetical protein
VSARTWGFKSPLRHQYGAANSRFTSPQHRGQVSHWQRIDSGGLRVLLLTLKDQTGVGVGGFGIYRPQDVLIQVRRDGGVGVAEALAHDVDGDAGLEARRGVGVSEPVQGQVGQAGLVRQPGEDPGELGRPKWRPVLAGEHQAVILPCLAAGEPLLKLSGAVGLERCHGRRVERNRALPGRGLRAEPDGWPARDRRQPLHDR